jgi:hypothetical protein
MPSKHLPSPKDVIKVRRPMFAGTGESRLPSEGDTLQLAATVIRVHPHDSDTRWDKVTVHIPGYPIPITLHLADLFGEKK